MLYSWRPRTPKDSSAVRVVGRAMPVTGAGDTLTRQVTADGTILTTREFWDVQWRQRDRRT